MYGEGGMTRDASSRAEEFLNTSVLQLIVRLILQTEVTDRAPEWSALPAVGSLPLLVDSMDAKSGRPESQSCLSVCEQPEQVLCSLTFEYPSEKQG